jgi:signal transduction histidine kinase
MRAVASWLDAIGLVFDAIPDLATPAEVQSALREILDDPALQLYWWDWELDRYVDVRGATADPSAARPGAVTTWIAYETRRVGAIVHDPAFLDDAEFREIFLPLMRIAMERDRLHRDLVAKLEQLRASRLRILKAGDDERRRLERNLHDGAQQRLTASLLGFRSLAAELAGDEALGPRAAASLAELEGGIRDLRELARGLDPPLLARQGLAAAIQAGAARASLPVALDLDLPRRLPAPVEAAAYYVCAEAVTNAVKHARATRVSLQAVDRGSSLIVTVHDDGIGGACIECQDEATGLMGLVDRVETLDGTLELESPEGSGTTLTAVFPLEREP